MFNHDLRSFSLNLLYLHFQYSDLDRLTVLLSLISPMNRGDLGTILISQCIHHQQLRL